MESLPLPVGKRVAESVKAGCRWLSRPVLPFLPDLIANRLPFLGRIGVRGPNNLHLRFNTYGPAGKDRIAIKLAKRGLHGYEGETVRLFLPLVRQAETVLDVGANTGLFALLAAAANPACQVWAFEPVPFIFDMLEKNVRLNRLTNLHTVQQAVADFVGESTFYVTRTNVGIPTDSSSNEAFRGQTEEFRLPTTTLDAFVGELGLASLDVLKIDAESTEVKVIRGAARVLESYRPYVICEVLENIDHGELQGTFESLDYRFYHIDPAGLHLQPNLSGSLEVDERNYLFVPAEKEVQISELCWDEAIPLQRAA